MVTPTPTKPRREKHAEIFLCIFMLLIVGSLAAIVFLLLTRQPTLTIEPTTPPPKVEVNIDQAPAVPLPVMPAERPDSPPAALTPAEVEPSAEPAPEPADAQPEPSPVTLVEQVGYNHNDARRWLTFYVENASEEDLRNHCQFMEEQFRPTEKKMLWLDFFVVREHTPDFSNDPPVDDAAQACWLASYRLNPFNGHEEFNYKGAGGPDEPEAPRSLAELIGVDPAPVRHGPAPVFDLVGHNSNPKREWKTYYVKNVTKDDARKFFRDQHAKHIMRGKVYWIDLFVDREGTPDVTHDPRLPSSCWKYHAASYRFNPANPDGGFVEELELDKPATQLPERLCVAPAKKFEVVGRYESDNGQWRSCFVQGATRDDIEVYCDWQKTADTPTKPYWIDFFSDRANTPDEKHFINPTPAQVNCRVAMYRYDPVTGNKSLTYSAAFDNPDQ